jgi:biotin carboxylase
VKLLAIEARQNATYYLGRYQQVVGFGADLHVLNGVGAENFWPAPRYRIVGSQKIDDIIEAARAWHAEERFDGILTFSESAVVTVAAVASALELPSVGVDAARTSRNKLLMRQAHERGGVPHPSFRFVLSVEEAIAAAQEYGYPVVLKPTLGAASNFVFRIDSEQEMRERFPAAIEGIRSMSWYVMECEGVDLGPAGLLVESFLDGHEHLFEALVWDDEVYLGSVVDRATAEGKNFDDDVHIAPTRLSDKDMAEIRSVVEAAVRAQGVRRSTLHAEIRYHQGRPHLVEMAIRPGGGALDMVARVTADYCPIRAVMDVARGVKPRVQHYTPTGVYMMGTCLICQAGEVEYVSIPDDIVNSEWTLMAKATATPGTIIKRPPDGNSILGFLVVTGHSYEDVENRLEDYASRIEVKLVGHPVTGTDTPWTPRPLATA